jgi:hypothetical protein
LKKCKLKHDNTSKQKREETNRGAEKKVDEELVKKIKIEVEAQVEVEGKKKCIKGKGKRKENIRRGI